MRIFGLVLACVTIGAMGCGEDPTQTVGDDTALPTPRCAPLAPTCDAPLPDLGPARGFRHTTSKIAASVGSPHHRGRDMYYTPADSITVMGKLAYGLADKDLEDEDVDVYLLRDCGSDWELVGTTRTTEEGDHETVEGVADSGGRVYFDVPSSLELGLGRHRFELVVAGDLTHVPVYVDVVPRGTPLVVATSTGR